MNRLHTVDEVAETLGRSRDWVLRQARIGHIPARRVGRHWRFTDADIATYLARIANRDPWARSPLAQARRARKAAS